MRPSPRFAKTINYAARAAAIASRSSAAGSIYYQYIYKIDDGDYHFKLIADLTSTEAIITISEVYEAEEPTVSTLKAQYETDHAIYPLGVGCPLDCFIYKFSDFSCDNARELRMYFSKQEIDLYGDGSVGYILGIADYNYEVYEAIYPCTRT